MAQLLAAQFGLQDAIAELERGGASTDAARSQVQALGDLQRQIAVAGPAALTSLRGEIVGAIATSRQMQQQGRSASNTESIELALAATSARTRATVERIAGDLFERRIFDPYLQFASAEDEAEYRRREARREEYIRRELAKGTPEGARNAASATVAQLEDARDHGADRSPEFETMWRDATRAQDEQTTATERTAPNAQASQPASTERPAATDVELDQIAAVFRAAGVQSPPTDPAQRSGHGLADLAQERGGTAAGRFT